MKATVCKSCGAPRDPAIDRALCRECFRVYKCAKAIDQNAKHAFDERARAVSDTYVRLGLEQGKVWKLVPR